MEKMPNISDVIGYINIIGFLILGFLQLRQTSKTHKTDEKVKLANEKEIEDRITDAVLKRAEAQLKAYKEENDKLRADNADLLKMIRVMRLLTIKLVRKMQEGGIDPQLTPEELESLQDTDKLAQFAKRNK